MRTVEYNGLTLDHTIDTCKDNERACSSQNQSLRPVGNIVFRVRRSDKINNNISKCKYCGGSHILKK